MLKKKNTIYKIRRNNYIHYGKKNDMNLYQKMDCEVQLHKFHRKIKLLKDSR